MQSPAGESQQSTAIDVTLAAEEFGSPSDDQENAPALLNNARVHFNSRTGLHTASVMLRESSECARVCIHGIEDVSMITDHVCQVDCHVEA